MNYTVKKHKSLLLLCSFFILAACHKKTEKPLFSLLPADSTGVHFKNVLSDTKEFNDFNFRNFYNGGGVAIGDINHDGLPDIVLSSNQHGIKLFLNKGNFHFEDITARAGLTTANQWTTGVTFADVDGDGWLDLYVCHGGQLEGKQRPNQLFINNHKLGFSDKAPQIGLDFKGYSVQAAFFDYDGDGDLDMFLLNNNPMPVNRVGFQNLRNTRDPIGGDRLYKNNNGKFEDVSEKAGIFGSIIGFGMGVTVGDVNGDMLPDIYISNDFHERDYLYINQGNGTFKEDLENQMGHVSESSMGADMADLNNDGFPEIFSTDMLPADDYRLKTMISFEADDYSKMRVKNGFYNQYMRNMLQLNNGDGTFSEIGELAGVEATDWSWSALMFDMNNDGKKDIFVANGIEKDLTNLDFLNYFSGAETIKEITQGHEGFQYKKYLDKIPSTPLLSYAFENKGDLKFDNKAVDWGFGKPAFSNGSAYADLNNDGALDLVVNNVGSDAFVYRNEAMHLTPNKFLSVSLTGKGMNTYGIGAKVIVFVNGQTLVQENEPSRGFQSCTENKLTFGLGNTGRIDSVKVIWPDRKFQVLTGIALNSNLVIDQKNALSTWVVPVNKARPIFKNTTQTSGLHFNHVEDEFSDFNEERLIPHLLSTEGPKIAVGDINHDGLSDFFICGALGQSGAVFLQKADGTFLRQAQPDMEKDAFYEATDAIFLDTNKDGFPDLLIGCGGYRFNAGSPQLMPRLYLNDGLGHFSRKMDAFSSLTTNASCIRFLGNNEQGLPLLFIGSRCIPGGYGLAPDSYLLEGDNKGHFKDITAKGAPELKKLGMVCSATLADIDGDGKPELITAGEWMPLKAFSIRNSRLTEIIVPGFEHTEGLWNTVISADLNGDGREDLVAGNLGLNSKLRGSDAQPLNLYLNDFDGNGSLDPIMTVYRNGKSVPFATKSDLAQQIPSINERFQKFSDYAGKGISELFTSQQMANAQVLKAGMLSSMVFINRGKGKFRQQALPVEAQFSPVFGITTADFNHDGHMDLLLGGNFYGLKPEYGRYDASYGQLFLGDGKGGFKAATAHNSGISLKGQIRSLKTFQTRKGALVIAGRNNDTMESFTY